MMLMAVMMFFRGQACHVEMCVALAAAEGSALTATQRALLFEGRLHSGAFDSQVLASDTRGA